MNHTVNTLIEMGSSALAIVEREHIRVAVPRLRVADAGDDGVGGDETSEPGVVVAGVVVVEAGGGVEALAGVEAVGVGGAGAGAHVAPGVVGGFVDGGAGVVGDDRRGAEV